MQTLVSPPRLVLIKDMLVGSWELWWLAPKLPGGSHAHHLVTTVNANPEAHGGVFPIHPLPQEKKEWRHLPGHPPSSIIMLPWGREACDCLPRFA